MTNHTMTNHYTADDTNTKNFNNVVNGGYIIDYCFNNDWEVRGGNVNGKR
jgi:hypothetical protein